MESIPGPHKHLKVRAQSFPPLVEGGGGAGKNCPKIVRIEDGSLGEIVDLALEIFPKGIPDNSVILLGPGTHLLRTGSSGFSKTCVETSGRLVRLCSTAQICPLPPVLSGLNPGRIFWSIVDLRSWVSNYFRSDTRGLAELWDCTVSYTTQTNHKQMHTFTICTLLLTGLSSCYVVRLANTFAFH